MNILIFNISLSCLSLFPLGYAAGKIEDQSAHCTKFNLEFPFGVITLSKKKKGKISALELERTAVITIRCPSNSQSVFSWTTFTV